MSDVTYDHDRGTGDTPHVFALHALAGELRSHIPCAEQDRIRMNFKDPEAPDSVQDEPTSVMRRVDETT